MTTEYVRENDGAFKTNGACFVRFYPTDWRSGCFGLSLQEEGLYIRICAYIFETGRRVSLDDSVAAKHLGIHTNAYRKVRDDLVAAGKLQAHSDGWGVRRAESELVAAVGANERPVSTRGQSRPADPVAEHTPPDTLGDTPPDTQGVISEKANDNYARLKNQEPRAKKGKEVPLSGAPTNDASRGSRLDREWTLPEDWRQWSRATFPQTTSDSVQLQADAFRDFWVSKPGKDARKCDWEATWRNWCRKAFATGPVRPMAQPPPSASASRSAAIRALLHVGSPS